MKRIVSIIAVAAVVTISCNTNPKAGTGNNATTTDTTGFSQFQQWKAQHELANPNQYGQTTQSSNTAKQTVVYVPERRNARNYSTSRRTVYSSESANTAKVYRKRGWSKAAKGAAIGGGTGAILGAVISKNNRVLGGVVGGVLGAGAGYGIGRHQDKKDGRY